MSPLKAAELALKEVPWTATMLVARTLNPSAAEFCDLILSSGFESRKHVLALPRQKTIYVAIPKAASTKIRQTLAMIDGRFSRSLKRRKRSRCRGPYGPRNMTVKSFYDLATSDATFKFSFVRNPYARAVSCWADKFAAKPLVQGDPFIDAYLAARRVIGSGLPRGPDVSLSFADFVTLVSSAPDAYKDGHLIAQSKILDIRGLRLDFLGKVETFQTDFARVLDNLKAPDNIRHETAELLNESVHEDWRSYYTPELARRIYRTYEWDFDQFRYSKRAYC